MRSKKVSISSTDNDASEVWLVPDGSTPSTETVAMCDRGDGVRLCDFAEGCDEKRWWTKGVSSRCLVQHKVADGSSLIDDATYVYC